MKLLSKEEREGWSKWWSVRLAFLAGTVVAAVIAAFPLFAYALEQIVDDPLIRAALALAGFAVCAGVPILTRLVAQPKGKCDE